MFSGGLPGHLNKKALRNHPKPAFIRTYIEELTLLN
jgi:hypothetical protein